MTREEAEHVLKALEQAIGIVGQFDRLPEAKRIMEREVEATRPGASS